MLMLILKSSLVSRVDAYVEGSKSVTYGVGFCFYCNAAYVGNKQYLRFLELSYSRLISVGSIHLYATLN